MKLIDGMFGGQKKGVPIGDQSPLAAVLLEVKALRAAKADFVKSIALKLGWNEQLSPNESGQLAAMIFQNVISQEEFAAAAAAAHTFSQGLARCARDAIQANSFKIDVKAINVRRGELAAELARLNQQLESYDKAVRRADVSYREQLRLASINPGLFADVDVKKLIEVEIEKMRGAPK